MNTRKASMNIKRKVHNEYVLPVMVYGSETWALKKAHMELLSVAQRKMERILRGITLPDIMLGVTLHCAFLIAET